MYNFFVDSKDTVSGGYVIGGGDYNHIKNVLRMTEGAKVIVSCGGKSDLCEIEAFDEKGVVVKIIEENYNNTELPIEITLFQGLPKSDKLELIIQKTVELGISKIVPVEMKNCVVKLDDKKKINKVTRWQAISESAAKQSKRNVIPVIGPVMSFSEMLKYAEGLDLLIIPYECKDGMSSTDTVLSKIKTGMKVGILIGPEGGFDSREIELAEKAGGATVSLGARILRTETAAIVSVAAIMLYSELRLGGE